MTKGENIMKNKFLVVGLLGIILLEENAFADETPTIVASGNDCGQDCSWSLDSNGTLTISGTGYMYNYGTIENVDVSSAQMSEYRSLRPWNDLSSEVKNVVVSGVTSVGARAFQRMDNLESITLSDSVTSVYRAFLAYDNALTSITLPNSITTIAPHAFTCLFNLENINIPDTVTSIGDKAFYATRSLTNIVIPDSVTSLGSDIFTGGVTATVYCHKDLNCSGQGADNIISYDKQGGVYMIGDKYYTSLENMQNDISRASNDTTDYTCGTNLNECKRAVLEAKGICQGAACDTFIQSDGNYMLKYNGKTYQSINDLLKGNYDKRRIYTVEEANFVAGERNTVTIRYR